jgi:L-alanine-DL-glutamate epimerase-like enolase superfamily enzyme
MNQKRTPFAPKGGAAVKIVDVKTAVVAYHGKATLVRIDSDDGLSGYGEANPDVGAAAIVSLISELKAELLGGLAESKKIANLAEIYSIPFAPHLVSTPLGANATCHTCAAVLSCSNGTLSRNATFGIVTSLRLTARARS